MYTPFYISVTHVFQKHCCNVDHICLELMCMYIAWQFNGNYYDNSTCFLHIFSRFYHEPAHFFSPSQPEQKNFKYCSILLKKAKPFRKLWIVNSFPRLCNRRLLKTLWQNEKFIIRISSDFLYTCTCRSVFKRIPFSYKCRFVVARKQILTNNQGLIF